MNVVERQLVALVGAKSAKLIIEHPNLHVLSLPAQVVTELTEGTVMVVPVGILCDLCDLPAANKFCQCESETITDDEGFSVTTKHRAGENHDRAAQIRHHFEQRASIPPGQMGGQGGAPLPPAYQRPDDWLPLRAEAQWDDGAQLSGDVQDRDPVEPRGVDDGADSSLRGRCVDPDPQSDTSVGEARSDAGCDGQSSQADSPADTGGGWSE